MLDPISSIVAVKKREEEGEFRIQYCLNDDEEKSIYLRAMDDKIADLWVHLLCVTMDQGEDDHESC